MTTRTILILTHGMYPQTGYSVTGNGIRAWNLAMGLIEHGYSIVYSTAVETLPANVYPLIPEIPLQLVPYHDKTEIAQIIDKYQPDTIIVGYWELMNLLPNTTPKIPVVLDLLAPRLVEMEMQGGFEIAIESLNYLKALQNADFYLCCTQRQKAFHLAWLMMSGVQCQANAIQIIPISAHPHILNRAPLCTDSPTFIYGGVNWAWRDPSIWIEPLLNLLSETGKGQLHLITGHYPLEKNAHFEQFTTANAEHKAVLKVSDFMPYEQMEACYLQGDIGIELSHFNSERELSFSFRLLDYLRCGLPIICNDFLEIAPLIREYDAGWTIDVNQPTAFIDLIQAILAGKENLPQKSLNAQRLINEHFNYSKTIQPLLDFCANPQLLSKQQGMLNALIAQLPEKVNIQALQQSVVTLQNSLEQKQEMLEAFIQERDRLLTEKDAHSATKEAQIQQILQERDALLLVKDEALTLKEKLLAEKDELVKRILTERDNLLALKEAALLAKDDLLTAKDVTLQLIIAEKEQQTQEKERQVQEKEQQLSAKETILQTVMAEKNQIIDALLQDLEMCRNTIAHFENRIYGLLSERQHWESIAEEKTCIIDSIVEEKTYNYAEKDKAIEDLIQQRTVLTQQYETALQKQDELHASLEDLQQRHDWVYEQWKTWEYIAEQRRLKTRLKKIKDFLHCEITLKPESATYRLLFKNFLNPLFTRWGKNNLAVVTRHDIFPVDHGAAAKIYHTARVLSFDYKKVFLITGDREKYFIFENGQMREALYPRRLRDKWYPSYETLRDSLTVKGVPEGESFLFFSAYDANFKLRVLYIAWLYGIQVYQAEFPSYLDACKWALNLFGGKTCVVEHNVEYRRVANTYGIRAEAEQFLKAEEVRQCNAADFVIAVSHDDKRLLTEAGVKAEKITMIPHGVDLEAFDNMPTDATIRERYGVQPEQILLMFHGIYSYRPNAEAVEIIGHTILPKLNARGYYPKCLAVGKYPPPSSNHPDLVYTGVVDSVAPYVKAADIAVVPLQDGGGTRMKILEYFAAAVPVIATAKGAEGIVLERERDILIRDEIDDLVDAIILLIEDKALRQKIGHAGRQVVEQMDWKNIGKRYVALFNQKA